MYFDHPSEILDGPERGRPDRTSDHGRLARRGALEGYSARGLADGKR
ncbi:hypothetical protein OP10G_2137 [Fimbriimonas ginsengisoli Gsoil 348]|uniref:Uncharacterized protein n=1 Tax=Fimbriimonas ginsengisoli Gsoil 348 TaxID=661478 RepID=A0A068NRW6_FIMGI|nr:hypothetical protein OP10G_2137 [Fimbriimonas ginsengisoli Gsoil 348]